jgi:hypothetical protein
MEAEQSQAEAAPVSGEEKPAEVSGEQGAEEEEEYVLALDEEGEGAAEAEGGEKQAPPEPEKKGVPPKVPANERIQQEIERRKAAEQRAAELEAKFKQNHPPQEVPFVRIDVGKFEEHLTGLRDQAEELRLEGKPLEAARKEREILRLTDAYEENERLQQEWDEKQKRQKAGVEAEKTFIQRLDQTADFYREQHQIPKETWDAAGNWLAKEFEAKPDLLQEFRERSQTSPMAAVRWAHEYVEKNMGAPAAESKESKEEGKKALPGGKGGPGGKTQTVKNYQQLLNLGSKAVISFKKSNPQAYQKILDAHMKKH